MKLCILMGSANISGGSYVIFQHALAAKKAGIDVTVVPIEPVSQVSVMWHPALEELRFATFEEVAEEQFDLALATWWKTIYEMPRINARQYAYFVQSIESWFYPDSEVALRNLVNSTYLLDLPGITEATWIQHHLRERFGRQFHLVKNGILKSVYRDNGPAIEPRSEDKLRVLVEGPLGVDFKNVARTIELVKRSRADEIWLLTLSPLDSYPGVKRVFSRVPAFKCPEIYRSCDVLVKLSYIEGMFGPPLEMFHCGGTSIVYDVTGFDEYIVSDGNALVVATDDEDGVVDAVNRIKDDRDLLLRLRANAMCTAEEWPDWQHSSAEFLEAVERIMGERPVSREYVRLCTEEFFKQYVRAENALSSQRNGVLSRSLKSVSSRVVRAVGKHRQMERLLKLLRAYLIEARRKPASRDRI